MSFDDAMAKVLRQGKYNVLMGRYFDWKLWAQQRLAIIWKWIISHFNLHTPDLPGINRDVLSYIFVIAAVILVLAIAASVIFLTMRHMRKQHKLAGDIFKGIDRETATPGNLLTVALNLSSQGLWRDAVRYCFAAVLVALDAKQLVRVSGFKTNNQIRRELRATAAPLTPTFTAVMQLFNAVWYGHKSLVPDDFNKYWQAASDFSAEVESYQKQD
jgi:hypothetical protein